MRTHHSFSNHQVRGVYPMSLRDFEERARSRHRRRMLVMYTLLILAAVAGLFGGA